MNCRHRSRQVATSHDYLLALQQCLQLVTHCGLPPHFAYLAVTVGVEVGVDRQPHPLKRHGLPWRNRRPPAARRQPQGQLGDDLGVDISDALLCDA